MRAVLFSVILIFTQTNSYRKEVAIGDVAYLLNDSNACSIAGIDLTTAKAKELKRLTNDYIVEKRDALRKQATAKNEKEDIQTIIKKLSGSYSSKIDADYYATIESKIIIGLFIKDGYFAVNRRLVQEKIGLANIDNQQELKAIATGCVEEIEKFINNKGRNITKEMLVKKTEEISVKYEKRYGEWLFNNLPKDISAKARSLRDEAGKLAKSPIQPFSLKQDLFLMLSKILKESNLLINKPPLPRPFLQLRIVLYPEVKKYLALDTQTIENIDKLGIEYATTLDDIKKLYLADPAIERNEVLQSTSFYSRIMEEAFFTIDSKLMLLLNHAQKKRLSELSLQLSGITLAFNIVTSNPNAKGLFSEMRVTPDQIKQFHDAEAKFIPANSLLNRRSTSGAITVDEKIRKSYDFNNYVVSNILTPLQRESWQKRTGEAIDYNLYLSIYRQLYANK